ncbi:hypothetical protein BJX63DRAFT_332976 [Aspergillus granulosus]|uniref:Uncharacterized protein n=1 Tax=Aspergillus granulosus TaxID=176169 RepID=A0ABR4H3F4_9EURO
MDITPASKGKGICGSGRPYPKLAAAKDGWVGAARDQDPPPVAKVDDQDFIAVHSGTTYLAIAAHFVRDPKKWKKKCMYLSGPGGTTKLQQGHSCSSFLLFCTVMQRVGQERGHFGGGNSRRRFSPDPMEILGPSKTHPSTAAFSRTLKEAKYTA